MTETIAFKVNGDEVSVETDASVPLLFILRNTLGLKGTRLGCGEGNCGACTVTVDGVPATSCDLPVSAVSGKAVGSVEGILDADHPLVSAIIDHQAGQCGYCLPGILTRASALLDAGQSRSEICAALDANLCRCGAHTRILAAINDVIAGRSAP